MRTRTGPRLWLLAALCCLTLAGRALAQVSDEPSKLVVPAENRLLANRLKYARQMTAEKQWNKAIETYDQLLREEGDQLVPLDTPADAAASTTRSGQLRWLCHRDILEMEPAGLQAYRQRVDPLAKHWLEQARQQRDTDLLRRIVTAAYGSSWTAAALDLLGDLACERGDFAQAQQWWQQITASAAHVAAEKANRQATLRPLDPAVDVARIRAKIILTQLLAGQRSQAESEWSAYQQLHPDAKGPLAGQDGKYVVILQEWFRKDSSTLIAAADWPTLGGNAAHDAAVSRLPQRRLWIDGPTWKVPLATREKDNPIDFSLRSRASEARRLRYYPVIAGDLVLVADAHTVTALDLRTGQKRGEYVLPDAPVADAKKDAEALERYSLTVAGERAYVLLGARSLAPLKDGKPQPATSVVVCLDLKVASKHPSPPTPLPGVPGRGEPDAAPRPGVAESEEPDAAPRPGVTESEEPDAAPRPGVPEREEPDAAPRPGTPGRGVGGEGGNCLTELWRRAVPAPEGAAAFTAAPLVHRDRVYVPLVRLNGLRQQTALACFHADTGTPLWEKTLFEIPRWEPAKSHPVVREPALVLAGNQIVCCTHQGLILAVDAETGKTTWIVRYPRRGAITIEGLPSPRELGPCLYADGRVYLAPMDTDRIFCLDALSGQTVWEREQIQSVHLLGCQHQRLIFTTPKGIRAFDASSGNDQGGWQQPDIGQLPPFGRGLVCAGWIFWPTQDPLYPLRVITIHNGSQQHGNILFSPTLVRKIAPGNMAFAHGCLVVAGTDELVGYVGQSPQNTNGEAPGVDVKAGSTADLSAVVQDNTACVSHAWVLGTINPRDAGAAHAPADLPLPLQKVWKQDGQLLSAHRCDTVRGEDYFGAWDGLNLQVRQKDGTPYWRCPLPFRPEELAFHEDIVLAAGPAGIAGLSLVDGKRLWGWLIAPGNERAGFAWLRPDPWALGQLDQFEDFAPDLSRFRLGQRRWLQLDPRTGKLTHLAWIPGAKIHPLQGAAEKSRTDELWFQWQKRPDRAIAVRPNKITCTQLVCRLNAFWEYTPRLPTTLTGELPHVFVRDDVILALLARNYGYDLERIDAKTGENVWKPAPRLCSQAFGGDSLHFTKDAVYSVSGNRMYARALADGKLLWQKELPKSTTGWRLLGSKQALLVYPAGEPEPEWITGPLGKYWVSLPVRKVRANRAFALRVHAFQDGTLLQGLDFGVTPRDVAVQSFPDMLIVASGGRVWGLRGTPEEAKRSKSP